jgi:HD-like signal output (HDOD) protein
LDQGSPFDQLLAWVGLDRPAVAPLTPTEQAADDALADEVRAHVAQNHPAPSSLPAVSIQVLNAVADPDLSLAELSQLVSQDPALAAGILRVANSPAYAGSQEIQTLRDAVTRLGMTEVGRVAGTVAARSLFQPQLRGEFSTFAHKWNELFAESVAAARGAAWLAMRVKGARSDHAFLAGMLHDLGRPVALRSVAALAMQGRVARGQEARVDRVLERVHVEVGADVHRAWGLPHFPTLAAQRHHDLSLPCEGEFVDVHVVRLASALVQFRHQPWRFEQARNEVNSSCAALHLDAFLLRTLDTQLRAEVQHVAQAFTEKPRRRVVL